MENNQDTLKSMKRKLFLLGLFKIPMVGFVRPRLIELNDDKASVRIKLSRRTKNHLGSMYFGALSVGSDLAAGLHAFYFAQMSDGKMSFSFKGVNGEFLMRAESHVVFSSSQGAEIKKAVQESMKTGERVNQAVEVLAHDLNGNRVARFEMIVSLKIK